MELDSDVPLPAGAPLVGIVANIKTGASMELLDAEAELDSMDTVAAMGRALNLAGARAALYLADKTLPEQLLTNKPDFVFNIAEGLTGRSREAQIPALLDMLNIPYTGSDATTLCIALDKALTKRLLATYHIKTPPYQLVRPETSKISHALTYPVIVKPNAEGSSKGIPDACIAKTPEELHALITRNMSLYREDMLVESFVGGREFTVGLLGNGRELTAFSPMEIVYLRQPTGGYNVYNYTVKQDYTKYVRYDCPARIDPLVEKRMTDKARKIFSALNCRDFARIDFRLSPDEQDIHFIEINPLPGLAPGYSDYPMLAEFCGVPYEALICRILKAAVKRSGVSLGLKEAEQ